MLIKHLCGAAFNNTSIRRSGACAHHLLHGVMSIKNVITLLCKHPDKAQRLKTLSENSEILHACLNDIPQK